MLDQPECSIRRFLRRSRQRRNAQESVACIFSGIDIRLLLDLIILVFSSMALRVCPGLAGNHARERAGRGF